MHPLWLHFDDPDAEREFRTAYDRTSLPTVRMAGVLGIAVYGLFGLLDTQVAEDGVTGLLIMRAAVVTWLAMCVAATFHPRFGRFHQPVVASAVLVAGLGMASMQVIADVPEAMPAMGVMLTLIFLFGFVRARLVPALLTAAAVLAGYEAALLLAERDALAIAYLNAEIGAFLVIGVVASHTLERLWRRTFLHGTALERERSRSDALLHNVLPETIARRLRLDPATIAESAGEVTVLFADIAGFTRLTERSDPQRLVAVLDRLFARFDELCDEFGVEKIKTIGDGYMAAAGAPDPHPDPAGAATGLALAMRQAAKEIGDGEIGPFTLRVGLATGPVLAGVIGRRRFAYDLWGDTVNLASRLESQAPEGAIQLCATTAARLDGRHRLDGPYVVEIRGKQPTEVWRLASAQVPWGREQVDETTVA